MQIDFVFRELVRADIDFVFFTFPSEIFYWIADIFGPGTVNNLHKSLPVAIAVIGDASDY